jgi:hypothetical protein
MNVLLETSDERDRQPAINDRIPEVSAGRAQPTGGVMSGPLDRAIAALRGALLNGPQEVEAGRNGGLEGLGSVEGNAAGQALGGDDIESKPEAEPAAKQGRGVIS